MSLRIAIIGSDGKVKAVLRKVQPAVGFLKVASALALLAGLLYPILVLPAAAVVAVLMIGAVAMHSKVGDSFKKSVPAALVLVLCVITIAGHWPGR